MRAAPCSGCSLSLTTNPLSTMKVFLLLLALCLSVSSHNPEDDLDIKTSVNVNVDDLDLTDEEKVRTLRRFDFVNFGVVLPR